MSDFDPYHKWLGIPPSDQPPNHYRLLGVVPFESDVEAISNAADLRMGFVRTFQVGPHSRHSQQILNELAAARICLLNADKKAAYDEGLRAEVVRGEADSGGEATAGSAERQEFPLPFASAPSPLQLEGLGLSSMTPAAGRSARPRGRGGRKVSRRPLAILAAMGVVCGLAVLAVFAFGPRPESDLPSPPTPTLQAKVTPQIKDEPAPVEATGAPAAPDTGMGSAATSPATGGSHAQDAKLRSAEDAGRDGKPVQPVPDDDVAGQAVAPSNFRTRRRKRTAGQMPTRANRQAVPRATKASTRPTPCVPAAWANS